MSRKSVPVAFLMLVHLGCANDPARRAERIRSGEAIAVDFVSEARADQALSALVERAPSGWSCASTGLARLARCKRSTGGLLHEERFVVTVACAGERLAVRAESHRSFDLRIAGVGELLHGAKGWSWVEDVDVADTEAVDVHALLRAPRD